MPALPSMILSSICGATDVEGSCFMALSSGSAIARVNSRFKLCTDTRASVLLPKRAKPRHLGSREHYERQLLIDSTK